MSDIDLSDIEETDDPRISEAGDQIIAGLRTLIDNVDPDIAAAIYDDVAEKLDALVDEAQALADASATDDDDALLAEVEEEPDDDSTGFDQSR